MGFVSGGSRCSPKCIKRIQSANEIRNIFPSRDQFRKGKISAKWTPPHLAFIWKCTFWGSAYGEFGPRGQTDCTIQVVDQWLPRLGNGWNAVGCLQWWSKFLSKSNLLVPRQWAKQEKNFGNAVCSQGASIRFLYNTFTLQLLVLYLYLVSSKKRTLVPMPLPR